MSELLMKCERCKETDITGTFIYASLQQLNRLSERSMCCVSCWRIIEFERAKFVKRPYKIPINRRGV